MEYLRYKPARVRPGAHSAMLDYAAAVLSGSTVAPRRVRAYRAWRKPASPPALAKTES